MRKKIIIVTKNTWEIYNSRIPLIKSLKSKGYDTIPAVYTDSYQKYLDIEFISLKKNIILHFIFRDIYLLYQLYKIYRSSGPDLVMHFNTKMNVYGSIAARLCGIRYANTITGLGSTFAHENLLTTIMIHLFRISLKNSLKIFFMNSDDKKLFLDNEIASITQAEMIPGSGIDIEKFKQSGKHKSTTSFTFLLFSRMIWDKGIGEYIKAAEIILKRYANVKFQLLGFLNCDNPYPVKKRQIGKWEQDGIIEYLGEAENVIPYIDKADCVVLPTYYREGIPKCLLEAMSMEKPVISTDVPGCRDLIEDGIDGFLCRPRDAIDLADKMQSMMDLPDEKRKEMGKNGREKIVNNYSDDTVFKKYLRFIEDITGI